MKLVLVADTRFIRRGNDYWTSGNIRRPLVEALGRHCGRVTIATRVREASPEEWASVPIGDSISADIVEFVALPTWCGPRGWFRCRGVVKHILNQAIADCDVCVARIPSPSGSMGVGIARSANKPVAAHVLGDPLLSWVDRVPTRSLRRLVSVSVSRSFNRTLLHCDAILSTSRGVLLPYMDDTREVAILADTSLTDADFLSPRSNTSRELIFFSASRLIPLKNIDMFFRAMRIVLDRGMLVKCVIAGDGPDLPRLKQLAQALRVQQQVVFLGMVRDRAALREHYRHADVGFLLSRSEGLPLAVIEAMAAGLPLLLSDIPQCREVADDHGAMFVGCDDEIACADAIARLANSSELRRRMASHNFERSREFHVDVQAKTLAEALAQLVR